jgi:hypothetical protein
VLRCFLVEHSDGNDSLLYTVDDVFVLASLEFPLIGAIAG